MTASGSNARGTMRERRQMPWGDLPRADALAPSGVIVVDKPSGVTSHDVVGAVRRLAGTRKVGHAGTLDPMATGVLTIGVGSATRLLTYLSGERKTYIATIAFGVATDSADADGAFIDASRGLRGSFQRFAQTVGVQQSSNSPEHVNNSALQEDAMRDVPAMKEAINGLVDQALGELCGPIMQVPPAISAKKISGKRAYGLARAGETVELEAQRVEVFRFVRTSEARALQVASTPVVEIDVLVECSAGTYIRSLARDLGTALGMGAHLRMLRRTEVGAFSIDDAATVLDLKRAVLAGAPLPVIPLADAATRVMPSVAVSRTEAEALRHGQFIELAPQPLAYPVALVADSQTHTERELVAIGTKRGRKTAPTVVFQQGASITRDFDEPALP